MTDYVLKAERSQNKRDISDFLNFYVYDFLLKR